MKKFVFIALSFAALAACTKVQTVVDTPREISFNVANYVQTKVSGVKYEGTEFGTWAWFNDDAPYLENERVGLTSLDQQSVWKTLDMTAYWPKTGAITFVSYSPYFASGDVPTVAHGSDGYTVSYSGYTVGQDDLLYADLVTCSSNSNDVTDDADGSADSGYNGVPTLFRHALAKVRFEVCAGALSAGTAPDQTTWEITVNSATVGGLYTSGDCPLTWSGSEWTKPEGNVWTNPAGAQEKPVSTSALALTTEYQPLGDLGFVLPQALVDQAITLDLTIKTNLPNGLSIEENITVSPKLADFSSEIKSWQMNQSIVYRILINPTSSETLKPILFDPAVADWDEKTAEFTIPV